MLGYSRVLFSRLVGTVCTAGGLLCGGSVDGEEYFDFMSMVLCREVYGMIKENLLDQHV